MNNSLQTVHQLSSSLYNRYPAIVKMVTAIDQAGGKAVLVGGAVRDALLGVQTKDFDIEVYGMVADQLRFILERYATVDEVGKSFGVFKMRNIPVDWSLPRTDSAGRRPDVTIDAHMDYKNAFARRDLTINAMGVDLMTNEFIDPYNGLHDLQHNILRSPSITKFVQDPLRFFRVMQFIARFEMVPDQELQSCCRTMQIAMVAIERVEQEFKKLFLQAKRPSLGLRWLRDVARLQEILPELHATIGIVQDKRWHPEGDVFEHSMQAVDAAAALAEKKECSQDEKLLLCYAALCHDLGKVSTTFEDAKGIHSYGHAEVGAPIAKSLLQKICTDKKIIKCVCKLVYFHMMPGMLVKSKARLCRYAVLAAKLAPDISMQQLADVATADRRGRNAQSNEPLNIQDSDVVQFIEKSVQAGVLHDPIKPLLTGSDLLPYVEDHKKIGTLLKKAYQLQLEKNVTDKCELLKSVLP